MQPLGSGSGASFLQHQTHRECVYRSLQFQKRSQLFVGAHNETFSVAMSVDNPNRSAFTIHC